MAKIGEDKLIELKGYIRGLQDATVMFCDAIERISVDPLVTQAHDDEICEKCKTCVHKVKYQDDVPCCDCDPKNDAEMYEPEPKEEKINQNVNLYLIVYTGESKDQRLTDAYLKAVNSNISKDFVAETEFDVIQKGFPGKITNLSVTLVSATEDNTGDRVAVLL